MASNKKLEVLTVVNELCNQPVVLVVVVFVLVKFLA